MDLTIDDDLHLRTRSGELLTINIPGLTCNFYLDHSVIYVDRLWIDGRPFPYRGGLIDPFESELASRIRHAIATDWADVIKRRWSEERDERHASRGMIQPFTGA